MFIYSSTITVLRAQRLRDSGGSLTPQSDWANAERIAIPNVSVQPVTTVDTSDADGIQATETWKVYGPDGVRLDIEPTDRIEWDGKTFDVVGNPQHWPALMGPGVDHTEITMKLSPPVRLSATGVTAILQDGVTAVATNQQIIFTP